MRSFTALVALAAVFANPGRLAAAQGEIKPFPKVDPYTKNDPEKVKKAGYVSFGPFRFGDDHTTAQVETTLGGIPLIWVESAHFKLGSGLPEYTLADDPREKDRVRAELERLSERLPDVKVKTRKLDPWLRLHLFALRLEDLYAQFLHEFGIQESEFPNVPLDSKRPGGKDYMGTGRFLGMPAKFTVLLFDKKSALGRYSNVYLGQALETQSCRHFPAVGSLLYLTAAELLEGEYVNDTALTCDVVSGVSQNLALGFRGFHVSLPFALGESIAHWFSRQVDPRYHFFSGLDRAKIRFKDQWNWAPSVRARVEHGMVPPLAEVLGWTIGDALEWADHLILWSQMDFLLAREDDAAGMLLRRIKEPATSSAPLTAEELAERARQAYPQAIGTDLAGFDAAWGDWVLKTYPKK